MTNITACGSCLCGAVAFRLDGDFAWFGVCHCSRCRKATGALAAWDLGLAAQGLHWLRGSEVIQHSSSGQRPFCGQCGTMVPHASQESGLAVVQAGLLDTDPGVTPEAHIFVASQPAWTSISDQLPCHDAYPAELNAPALPDLDRQPQAGSSPDDHQGSCLCGNVRFAWSGQALAMRHCHCSRCRKARSAAHASNIFVPMDQFRWLAGADRVQDFALPGAVRFGQAFCQDCGGKVPRAITQAKVFNIPAGSMDSDPGVQPREHIHVADKAPWHQITDDLPQHPAAPG